MSRHPCLVTSIAAEIAEALATVVLLSLDPLSSAPFIWGKVWS